MSLELQNIDCNCNNCIFMQRNIKKYKSFDYLYGHSKKASHRVNYGYCDKFKKKVSFIPNICQIETQKCFKNRK
jgi:hypothetical protein